MIKGSENKETKISELGKCISYSTLSRDTITIIYIIIRLKIQSLSLSNICYRWSHLLNINIAIYSGRTRDQCSFFYPFENI